MLRWLILLTLVAACTHQRAKNIEVIWASGGCIFIAHGMTLEQAKALKQSDWKFRDCAVEITESPKE